MILDRVEFEEVSWAAVIKYLKMRSKELDPEGTGVNLFWYVCGGNVPTVTMLVEDIPMLDKVKYLCQAVNATWVIGDKANAVVMTLPRPKPPPAGKKP